MKKHAQDLNPKSCSLGLWGKPVQAPLRTLTGRWLLAMTYAKDSAQGPFSEVFGPGRFNPPGSFPILYLASDDAACRSAIQTLAQDDESVFESRVVAALEVTLSRVLDLCDPGTRRKLKITLRDLQSTEDRSITQGIGLAARRAGLEGIVYPVGNRLKRRNLAVFLEEVTPAELTPTVLNWPSRGSGTAKTSS
jgi:RES domain-containing protein